MTTLSHSTELFLQKIETEDTNSLFYPVNENKHLHQGDTLKDGFGRRREKNEDVTTLKLAGFKEIRIKNFKHVKHPKNQ